MSATTLEIARDITLAVIQNDVFYKKKSSSISSEELNQTNAEYIGQFYALKTILKHVNEASKNDPARSSV